jgi:hypothetical protein
MTGQPSGICPFRAQTGYPCLGCYGTRAFVDAVEGRLARGFRRNALGAFLGVSAWVLALAAALSLATGWRRPLLWALVLVGGLLPVAFAYRAVTWFAGLPPAALQLH